MSYKIKIIDNDNGKVLLEENEALAIVGSVVMEENTLGVCSMACDIMHRAMGIYTAQQICNRVKKKDLKLEMMVALAEATEDKHESIEIDLSEFKKEGD